MLRMASKRHSGCEGKQGSEADAVWLVSGRRAFVLAPGNGQLKPWQRDGWGALSALAWLQLLSVPMADAAIDGLTQVHVRGLSGPMRQI